MPESRGTQYFSTGDPWGHRAITNAGAALLAATKAAVPPAPEVEKPNDDGFTPAQALMAWRMLTAIADRGDDSKLTAAVIEGIEERITGVMAAEKGKLPKPPPAVAR